MDLGFELKRLRKQHGFKQSDISDKLGISLRTYQGYESNDINLTMDKFCKVLKLYDMKVDMNICKISGPKFDHVTTANGDVIGYVDNGSCIVVYINGKECDSLEADTFIRYLLRDIQKLKRE